jgi:hypothetical protein
MGTRRLLLVIDDGARDVPTSCATLPFKSPSYFPREKKKGGGSYRAFFGALCTQPMDATYFDL